jgi:uroporphyrinogen-III synthase
MRPAAKAPLSGVRVLVGRARHQASELSAGLRTLGAEVIEIPFIEIRRPRSYKPLDSALRNIADYDWLILTSVNGVDAVADRIKKLRLSPTNLKHLRVAAIGPATAERIRNLGLKVAVVPEKYVAESVVTLLQRKVAGKRVLLARAKVARDVIPRELRKLGAGVDVVEAYETVVPQSSRTKLRAVMNAPNRRPDIIGFSSSSTVRNFVALLGGRRRPPHTNLRATGYDIRLVSIGPVTSATLREYGLQEDVEAKPYTIPGLIRAIVKASRA